MPDTTDNQPFPNIDNLTTTSTLQIAPRKTQLLIRTEDQLKSMTKAALIDLASEQFGLSITYQTNKPIIIEKILAAQGN